MYLFLNFLFCSIELFLSIELLSLSLSVGALIITKYHSGGLVDNGKIYLYVEAGSMVILLYLPLTFPVNLNYSKKNPIINFF